MSSQTSLQGGTTYQAYLQQNPTLLQEPSQVQADVALRYFNSRMEKQPGWNAEPPEVKQQAWQQFRVKNNVPEVKPAFKSIRPAHQVVQAPNVADYDANNPVNILKDLGGATLSTGAGAIKGLSFGWLDPTEQARQAAQAIGARNYSAPIAEMGGDIAGAVGSGELLARGLQAGLGRIGSAAAQAGRNLMPYTVPEFAQAFPRLGELPRVGVEALTNLQQGVNTLRTGKTIVPKILRGAIEGGAYGALSRKEQASDWITQPIGGAIGGGALGAAGHGLEKGIEKAAPYLRGAASFTRELVDPSGMWSPSFNPRAEELVARLTKLSNELGLTEREAAAAQKSATRLGKILKSGRRRDLLPYEKQAKALEGRAAFRNKTGKARKPVEQREAPAKTESTPEPQAAIESQGQGQPKPKATPLKGSVQEMVSQLEKEAGLPEGAGHSTAGQVEKQIGRKLTTEEKDAHTNLRAIARTEAVDANRGIHKQFPVNTERNLKYEAIKGSVSEEHRPIADKLDEAMAQGKAIRVEYAAEEAGRSNEAAKLTKTGNVKVDTTDFTPLHWSKTNNDKVMVHGYNQRGHFVSYHLEPSTNGSQILKAGKTVDRAFVGEYPNIYLDSRSFLAKDVLGRGVRSAEGVIKTSEAIKMMEEVTNNLDKILALADDSRIPDYARKALSELRGKANWTQKDVKKLQALINKKELKRTICDILGLTHG